MIDYARAAGFDFVLSAYNRQHAHWFVEAGFKNVAWLPGIWVRPLNRPFSDRRKPEVCFIGSSGDYHPRRKHLLHELNRRGAFPLTVMTANHEASGDRYAATAVSLNCSLNGDLNLRIFEILSAGGCLLADRLSPAAGFQLLLEEGRDFIGYDSVEECIDQASFLLSHPDLALEISRAGLATFTTRLKPEFRIRQLFEWIFEDRLDAPFRISKNIRTGNGENAGVPTIEDRIRVYDHLQEIQRACLSPSVLFLENVPDIYVLDALDLRHTRMSIVDNDAGPTRSREILDRCRSIRSVDIDQTAWDAIVSIPRNAEPEP